MPALDLNINLQITGYEVGCQACLWHEVIRDGDTTRLDSHRMPVLYAVHHTLNGQPQEWRCRKPRVLR